MRYYSLIACNVEHLRSGCDFMHVFFLVDECTDVEPASSVREMVDVVLDAMQNPQEPRPAGEVILGEIARQYVSPLLPHLRTD